MATKDNSHELNIVGKPWMKVDAMGKVTGETLYADDIFLPRMAYGKILRSPHPHARIKYIDPTPALERPGVLAVITGKDLPVKYGILPVSQDEEALCTNKVRMVGDPVAAVAAMDEETAEAALEAIIVEYELLPAILSVEEALENDAVQIHEYAEKGNIHKHISLEFGDVAAGFAAADHIREDIFYYEGNTHLAMEQHAAVAQYDAGSRLTLWSSTQTPHYVHRALEKVLGLPRSRIRVIATPNGGGFGGKTDPFPHEIIACKLAMVTGRPVKITLTREEVFYTHRGRHPVLMWVKTGMKKDGAITAMHFRSHLDGGAYGSYGVASAYYTGALQTVTYPIANYKFEAIRAFTNKPPCGPKRGHGTPQPRFAVEAQLDKFAADLGIDPAELRLNHIHPPHSKTINHLTVTTIGLGACIEKVVEASRFQERHGKLPPGKGVGLAGSAYLSGAGLPIYWNKMPHSGVQIKIDRGGGVTVFCGSTDIGQGSTSILAYIVAEELGLKLDDVVVYTGDTDLTPVDLGSYSSRVTLMTGNAAIAAARPLVEKIVTAVSEKLDIPAELLSIQDSIVYSQGVERLMTFAEAAELAEIKYGTLGSVGSYKPPRRGGRYKGAGVGPSPNYSYSACVAEVTVNPDTGFYTVDKLWLGHDIGKAINPMLVIGQVEGSAYMGLSEAMMEEQVFRRGLHKIPSMLDYKSLTALEMPEIETFLIETNDPEGPYGAKEAGQGPLLPIMPAVANAIYDAVGVRVDEVPITPEKVLKALERKRRGQEPRVGPTRIPTVVFPKPVRVEPPEEMAVP
ncbi:MAG: molybdopterin cofactor-binding domain-containing protein [Anaerolineae bacterium]